MNTIILVSHGSLADGMKEAVNMIAGNLANYQSIGLKDGMGIEAFAKDIELLLKSTEDEHFLVVTDLKGGSPHTKTLEVIQSLNLFERTTVISGMNLALVLALSFVDLSSNEAIEHAILESRANISTLECFEDNDELL